jgi:hypothetical protein
VDDIAKALERTRVYLIDRRTRAGAGARFADNHPVVAVEGALEHTWAKGRRVWVAHLLGVKCGGVNTDHRPSAPTRDVDALSFRLWLRESDDEQATGESVWSYSSPPSGTT